MLSEEKSKIERLHNDVITEYHSLQPTDNFIQRFYEMAITQIGQDNLINLSFYYDVLEKHSDIHLANEFRYKVEDYISEKVKKSPRKPSLDEWYVEIPNQPDIFKDYLEQCINTYQVQINSENLTSIFTQFFNSKGWNGKEDKEFVENLDRQILAEVLWTKTVNERYRKKYIISILKFPEFTATKREQVRNWIVEILKERIFENPESKIPVEFWLEQTNDLQDI